MEWISFSLNREKSATFEHVVLSNICKDFAYILKLPEQIWEGYRTKSIGHQVRYYFRSNNPFLMQHIKNWVICFERNAQPAHPADLVLLNWQTIAQRNKTVGHAEAVGVCA